MSTPTPSETPDRKVEPVDILIVDDRPSNVLSLAAMLQRPDYRIVTAESGYEALARVLERDFAVILLDVAMPGMDGFETASMIKQRERSSRIPIVFVTASTYDLDHVFRGYALGAVDYLRKPIDPHVVRAKVAVFVELFRQRQQIRQQSEWLQAAEERERQLLLRTAEDAIRQREEEYAVTFEEAPVGIARLGPDGRVLKANEELVRMLGPSVASGPRLPDFFAASDQDSLRDALARLASGTARRVSVEAGWAGPTGESWARLALSALPQTGQGNVIAVVEDVTEQRRAEQAQTLLTEAGAALLTTLERGEILHHLALVSVRDFAGWAVIEGLGGVGDGEWQALACAHSDPDLQHHLGELHARVGPFFADQVQSGRLLARVTPDELQALAPDPQALRALQELRADSMIQVPLRTDKRPTAVLTLVSWSEHRVFGEADLATARELKHLATLALDNARLLEAAEDAVRVREEFLSVAAHELRTPLTSLRLQVQMLLRRGPGNEEEVVRLLERANRQVSRLSSLVDGLLDVARIREKRLRLETETFDLADAVREVVERSQEDIRATGSVVHLDIAAPGAGNRDRLRMEQVITNLLSNAIKYGEGKPIHVRLDEREDGTAVLTLRDEGIGIPQDRLERIFERFERAVPSVPYGGLGLGLYIVRQIVEAHGGKVFARSGPGAGATFTVELPREAVTAQAGAEPAEPPHAAPQPAPP